MQVATWVKKSQTLRLFNGLTLNRHAYILSEFLAGIPRHLNYGIARGSIINKYGQQIEVREYQIDQGKSGKQVSAEVVCTLATFGLCAPMLFSEGEVGTYWLYFCNGELVQWGKAGNWAEAQRMSLSVN